MAQIQLTEDYVYYQSETRLLDLAYDLAGIPKLSSKEAEDKINKATKIRLWLEALDYSDYLTRSDRESIWYCLGAIAEVNDYPYTPTSRNVQAPSIVVGIPGAPGATGPVGPEGGGVPFSAMLSSDGLVDSFDISLARAAEWKYSIYSSAGQRAGEIVGGWSSDGVSFGDNGGIDTTDIYGDTSPVSISVVVIGTTASLFATVSSGTWTIEGTRKFIPYTGSGVITPSPLADGKIWVGNSSNLPIALTMTGDITITNGGVTAIGAGVIVNADISSSAAIALSKLATLTASKVVVTNSSGVLTTSSVTSTELGYVAGATSNIQAQINAIAGAGAITGAITTYVASNATPDRAIVSNAIGKLTTSGVSSTELGYVSGASSNLQAQINALAVSMPVGAVLDYAGTAAPTGFLLCYGQIVSRTTYSALFAAIGTTYGNGNGTTTFQLPDFRGRVSAGKDDMGGSSANRLTSPVNGDVLGASGGSESHTLTQGELPHVQLNVGTGSFSLQPYSLGTEINATAGFNGYTINSFGSPQLTTDYLGSGTAHSILQPTIVVNKIIKY
jgi:microcystin-dependent protein